MAAATDGTKGTGLAFKTLGVDVKDSHGNLRDAKVVMEEAFSALGNVKNETERNALAMKLFGKSAMQLNPIISAGGDELKKLTDEARNNGAVMSNDAVAGLDTLGDTLDNLKTSILGSVGNMLAGLLPDIQKFLDNLMQLPDWIQKNSTLLEVIGVIIGTITALIIAFNIQQALATAGLTLWGAIAAGATTVTTALGAAFAFLTSPIGLIILAIGAVIAIGVLLYRNWDTIKEACIAVWGMITDKINVAIEFVKNLFNRFLEFIGGLLESIKTSFVNGWNAVATFFTETIPKIIKTIIDWFAKLPGNIWDTLVAIITKLAEWEAKVIIWIASNIAKVIKSFIDFFISLPGKVWDAVIAIIDKLGNLKDKMINWVTTEIPTFILKFVGYIAELPKKMLSIGGDIVKGIWEGIKNAADWLWDKIAGFAKWIVDGLKDFLGIKSPSKLLADEVGKFMAQGIGIGFTAEIDNVTGIWSSRSHQDGRIIYLIALVWLRQEVMV
jgi:phage-related protein